MFARVNIFEGAPEGIDAAVEIAGARVVPALEGVDGFAGMLILADRTSGKSLGITLWHTEDALKASEKLASGMRSDVATESGERVVGVERYEVMLDERRGS